MTRAAGAGRTLGEDSAPEDGPAFLLRSMLVAVRAAATDASPPGVAPAPPAVLLEEHPRAATAWVLGASWHGLGRLPGSAGLRAALLRYDEGGLPALEGWLAAQAPDGDVDLPERRDVFVTGAYLAALGRLPDTGGRAAHLGLLEEEGEQAVLASLLGSPEAEVRVGHPPPPPDPVAALVRAVVDSVGLQDPAAEAALAEAASEGRPTTWLVRAALRLRHGRWAALVRRPAVPGLVRHVTVLAELRTGREVAQEHLLFSLRLHRQAWGQVAGVAARVADLQRAGRPGGGPDAGDGLGDGSGDGSRDGSGDDAADQRAGRG